MGKDFKDIDLSQSAKAAEPAVDFAVEEDVDVQYSGIKIPQYKLDALRRHPSGFTPAGRELGRPPQTKEQWDEWEAELEREVANGEFYTPEEFEAIIKSECKRLFSNTRQDYNYL